MKCNSKDAVGEKYWNLSLKFAVDNLKVAMVVLHNEFGFGPERLTRFLDGVANTSARYNQAFDDEVMDNVIDKDVRALGIPDEYVEMLCEKRLDTRKEYYCAHRNKNKISFREANEAVKRLQVMKEYQNNVLKIGINNTEE